MDELYGQLFNWILKQLGTIRRTELHGHDLTYNIVKEFPKITVIRKKFFEKFKMPSELNLSNKFKKLR